MQQHFFEGLLCVLVLSNLYGAYVIGRIRERHRCALHALHQALFEESSQEGTRASFKLQQKIDDNIPAPRVNTPDAASPKPHVPTSWSS